MLIDTIYFEKDVKVHHRTRAILNRFHMARHIEIERYGEVFNKRSQNFRLQKGNPALILAHKHSGLVHVAPTGYGIGGDKSFYFAHMSNCLYDCRYCFLQGMFASANYVLYVNFEDFDVAIMKLIEKYSQDNLTFFSGYDCDSLALESITGFATHILPLFKKNPSAVLEFRTKSIQITPFTDMPAMKNCIIAFSMIPDAMSKILEPKVPSIKKRINAMVKLAEQGWKIGLRFDPLIHGRHWKEHYRGLFEDVFENIPKSAIHSVSYGPLRFPHAMFHRVKKLYPEEILFAGTTFQKNRVIGYTSEVESEMSNFCRIMFKNYIPESIIFRCG